MNTTTAPARFLLALLAFALPLQACGSDDDDATATSSASGRLACDNRAIESTCADFAPGTTRAVADGSCDGALLEAACPSASAVGRCTVKSAQGELVNTYYSDGPSPRTEASARETCNTFGGVFTAP